MLAQGESSFVTDGLELWYRVSGTGPACLVPTPGWGVSADFYFRTLPPAESFLTMIYLDTRGTGRSEKPAAPEEYTYASFAADFEALRRHLGLDNFLIMGHSHAGIHAMNYALGYPAACAGLILVDTLPAFDQHYYDDVQANMMARQHEPWFEAAYAAITSPDEPQSDDAFGRYCMAIMPFYLVDQRVAKRYAEALAATTFSVAARAGQQAVQLEINLLPRLKEISAPTLLIVGSDDFICSPLQSERIHFRITNSKLVVIQQAGHFPWLERPDHFHARLRAGLQALGHHFPG